MQNLYEIVFIDKYKSTDSIYKFLDYVVHILPCILLNLQMNNFNGYIILHNVEAP